MTLDNDFCMFVVIDMDSTLSPSKQLAQRHTKPHRAASTCKAQITTRLNQYKEHLRYRDMYPTTYNRDLKKPNLKIYKVYQMLEPYELLTEEKS